MQMKFDYIPKSIREVKQWVLWSFQETKGEKLAKVPCNIAGVRANPLEIENHYTFDEALYMLNDLETFNCSNEIFDGIGFVFIENGGYTGIDLDDCVNPETGEIQEWAQEIINELKSYTEYSVSGSGFHMIVKGKLPGNRKRIGNIEMYDSKRFFVVTGNRTGDFPEVMERQDELTALYNRVFSNAKSESSPLKTPNEIALNKLTDKVILELLFSQSNGGKWRDLYEQGWTSGKKYVNEKRYPSQSEADMAFCMKLAFFTDEADQIKRIMDSSALGQREKWTNRSDYSDRVIEHALNVQTKKYAPLVSDPKKQEPVLKVESSTDDFPEIVKFDKYELPVFPTDIFPAWGKEFIEGVAESTQTPVDMAGMLFLAALAVSVQRKFVLQISPNFTEPLCLYVLVIMPPANRKTAVFNEIMKPIRLYEKNQARDMEEIITERQALLEALKAEQSAIISKMKKGESSAVGELQKIKQKLRNTKELFAPSLIKQDITAESLIEALRQNNSRIGVLSDEGGILDIIGGLYSKGKTNIDIFLKGHTGMEYTYDRKGSESAMLDRVTITLGITLQNSILNDFLSNGVVSGRGLPARCLFSIPETLLGQRKANSLPIPSDIQSTYQRNILNILSWNALPETEPTDNSKDAIMTYVANTIENKSKEEDEQAVIIRFSEKATKVYEQFFEQHEVRLAPNEGDLYEDMLSWGGKHVGHIMRIAGLLHVANNADKHTLPLEVQASTVESAISLSEYLIVHARKAYGKSSPGNTISKQEAIIKAILADENCRLLSHRYSKTDIWRLVRKQYKKAKDVGTDLEELVMRGYLMEELIKREGRGRDYQYYFVNPKVFDDAALIN
ncbi:DUF3987 domain-containing protein [Paenibacillus xylanexedens]|uniref:phage NrS-1 polymerase family protein n=1 Tax=Paenibacillus xylanexedens TaxID=528191 RepID=UPI003D04957D